MTAFVLVSATIGGPELATRSPRWLTRSRARHQTQVVRVPPRQKPQSEAAPDADTAKTADGR